jgi:peptidyl-prolyl cis-trans isomerase C/peptidyl-prolyl cis-trans isomerase D
MKLLLTATLACVASIAQAQVLATVGNSKITLEDFKKKYEVVRQAPNAPTPEQLLEDMVRFEIGVQEAGKEKFDSDPIVKERFKQVLYNALLEKHVSPKIEKINITEKEMRAYYKKNPEMRLAHILIEVKANAKPEERELARKHAQDVLNEVKKSKRPFEELVKVYSDDLATKDYGGDIGFQSRVTLMPYIYDAALEMQPGDVRGLIETHFGFHIIKLIDKRSYELADKQQVRAALFEEKRGRLFNEYFDKAKRNYKVQINREAIKSIKN